MKASKKDGRLMHQLVQEHLMRNEYYQQDDNATVTNPPSEFDSPGFYPPREHLQIHPILWDAWQEGSNNFFICRGRIMFGKDYLCYFTTMFLITTPTVIFLLFVAPELKFEVHAARGVSPCGRTGSW